MIGPYQTDVAICNRALSYCQLPIIETFDPPQDGIETNEFAPFIQVNITGWKFHCFSANENGWNFSTLTTQLDGVRDCTLLNFKYVYALPQDCIGVTKAWSCDENRENIHYLRLGNDYKEVYSNDFACNINNEEGRQV